MKTACFFLISFCSSVFMTFNDMFPRQIDHLINPPKCEAWKILVKILNIINKR